VVFGGAGRVSWAQRRGRAAPVTGSYVWERRREGPRVGLEAGGDGSAAAGGDGELEFVFWEWRVRGEVPLGAVRVESIAIAASRNEDSRLRSRNSAGVSSALMV
jgi:hypothetical protein